MQLGHKLAKQQHNSLLTLYVINELKPKPHTPEQR